MILLPMREIFRHFSKGCANVQLTAPKAEDAAPKAFDNGTAPLRGHVIPLEGAEKQVVA
jgi:hypothetical protein